MLKKTKTDYSSFNIIGFLDEYGISYRTSGKNIANGWIGIETCPFCSGSGFHFGVKLSSNNGSCWICGDGGNAVSIIANVAEVSWKEAYQILHKFNSDVVDWIPESDKPGQQVILPDGIREKLTKSAKQYLIGRKYNPDFLVQQYKIRCTDQYSTLYVEDREWDFSERILCPVYMNRQMQCYVARDYTGEKDPKYMNSPVVASIREPRSCIYNYDTLKGKIIIVEGITDVWRFGAKVGAFLGITFTPHQIRSLAEKDIEEATVLFDRGAEKRAKELAHSLASVIPVVRVAFIEEDDPGVMEQDVALKVKYQLIGEV